jgi:gamma-glutamylputrescine oxidase
MLNLLYANDRKGEHADSWYAATANTEAPQPRLEGERQFNVCVIGGGLTGISTALHLAEKGYSVCVLEAHRAGWGASGRNGGQVNSGQRVDQIYLEDRYGRELAHRYWAIAEESKALVRSLINHHDIDCHLVDGIVHADHRQRFLPETRAYAEKLATEYEYPHVRFLNREALHEHVISPAYYGGAIDAGAFHLHPLAFTLGLAKAATVAGVEIFENSEVLEVTHGQTCKARTADGEIKSQFLVYACNGYLGGLEPEIARRVLPINNFIIVTEPLTDQQRATVMPGQAAVADSKFVINYFRMTHDNRLLFGGGENYGYRFPDDIKAFVRKPMLEIFPELERLKIDYGWGGTLAITAKRVPLFRRVAGNALACTGYSGHGVAMATLAGRIAADAIVVQTAQFDIMAKLETPVFPGGTLLRYPLLILAMTWFSLRDKL